MKKSLRDKYLNDAGFHMLVATLEGALKEYKFIDLLNAVEVLSEKIGGVDTVETHRVRHRLLHECLDELIVDFLMHAKGSTISYSPIRDLMSWSARQIKFPDDIGSNNNGNKEETAK